MEGWNNPLPIGRSIRDLTRENNPVSDPNGKRYPRLLGQGGVIAQRPEVHRPPIPSPPFSSMNSRTPRFLQSASYNPLPTHRVLYHPPATPTSPTCAQTATSGFFGGNHLPWQGQRPPHPKPPSVEQLICDTSNMQHLFLCISFGVVNLVLSFSFLSLLSIFF